MATAKPKSSQPVETPATTTEYKEPKRLSKFALWRRANPNGIFVVNDWRAVNK